MRSGSIGYCATSVSGLTCNCEKTLRYSSSRCVSAPSPDPIKEWMARGPRVAHGNGLFNFISLGFLLRVMGGGDVIGEELRSGTDHFLTVNDSRE